MSLEQIVKDLTAALTANTAALLAAAPAPAAAPAAAPKPPAAQTPPKATTPPVAPKPPAAPSALTYAAVAEVVTNLVKVHGRTPAVILLEPFKVTTIVPFKDKPAELAQIYAIFTDEAKVAAAIAAAAAAAKAPVAA